MLREFADLEDDVEDFVWTLTVLVTLHEGKYLQVFDLKSGLLKRCVSHQCRKPP